MNPEFIFRSFVGVVVLIGIAYLFSRNRSGISWRQVLIGLILQLVLGILLTQIPFVQTMFGYIGKGFVAITSFTADGARFIFGEKLMDPSNEYVGFIFVIQVLPILIFFSALSSALYYLGILQFVVKIFAWIMARTMRLSGAESISAAANVFLGQTEAPLLVKPYVAKMTRSEMLCLMTAGMATIAGSVLATYVGMMVPPDVLAMAAGPLKDAAIEAAKTEMASRLLIASLMNAPAAIVFSKILIPETNPEAINADLRVSNESIGANFIDALANGTTEGLKLAMNVAAMLLTFIAIIYMLNAFMSGVIGDWTYGGDITLNEWVTCSTSGRFDGFSLQYLLGQMFRLVAFAMGVEWVDTLVVGSLLGTKTIVNEFVAYSDLSRMPLSLMSEHSRVITTFALCGFANFSSIAIQIGGIGGLAPEKRPEISKLGLLAVLGGTLATFMSGTIAGSLY